MASYLTRANFLTVIAKELHCQPQIDAALQSGGDAAVDNLLFMSDLKADSLDMTALTIALEAEFDISITGDDEESLWDDCSVAHVYKLVERIHSHQFAPAH